ncbi:hypothetical protein B484DRAFT_436477 [Ochromonadaceae sp. CCMP2298]|nr:hypothetical protein B484DRAFT_436477 [Ochromonadaceae sp. CCMP2298]
MGGASTSGAFKGSFTPQMDVLLLEAVEMFGRDWVKAAAHVSRGSGCTVDRRQCRHKKCTKLDPALQELNNMPLSDEESAQKKRVNRFSPPDVDVLYTPDVLCSQSNS